MNYEVTLTFTVQADSAEDANDLGIAAAQHLADTFNDDDSISNLMATSVKEIPT